MRSTRRNQPKSSVKWQGFTFVPITGRPRKCSEVVEVAGHIFTLCKPAPDAKVATSLSYLFRDGRADIRAGTLAQALYALGLITTECCTAWSAIENKYYHENLRKRVLRDLRYALDELNLSPSPEQQKVLTELNEES